MTKTMTMINNNSYFSIPAIMMVLAFPPKLSLSSHVNTEFRYGMKSFFLASLRTAFSLASAESRKIGDNGTFKIVLLTESKK